MAPHWRARDQDLAMAQAKNPRKLGHEARNPLPVRAGREPPVFGDSRLLA